MLRGGKNQKKKKKIAFHFFYFDIVFSFLGLLPMHVLLRCSMG